MPRFRLFRLKEDNEDKQAAIAARLGICRNCLQRRKNKQQGTRIAIRIDGQLNASLIKATKQTGVTKRAYLKEALIRRLSVGGFL